MAAQAETAKTRGRLQKTAAAFLSGLAVVAGLAEAKAAPLREPDAGIGQCLRYRQNEREVCSAYVGNSAEIALQAFYKLGNNRSSFLSSAARHHFETRYWLGPRQKIEKEVDGWPKTGNLFGNTVDENIRVISVKVNHPADLGLVKTEESWVVTAPNGNRLHNEPEHTKNITMCRGKLPGFPHFLHLWMVVKNSRDPGFDCIAFDRANHIKP